MNILITPLLAGKPWNGTTIYTEPLGGSEAAVAYMARSLARMGHVVVVLTHGATAAVDNVQYIHTPTHESAYDWLRGVMFPGHDPLYKPPPWDVVISSRRLDILEQPVNTRLIVFWTHDIPRQSVRPRCHICFVLSEFHARSWAWDPLHPEPFILTSDGVDVAAVGTPLPQGDRDPNKLVWASNPDRGLPVAAYLMHDIRERWPELELHVYGRSAVYGWGPEAEAPFLPRDKYTEGIVLHDPLPRAQLFEELKTAWAMFYPTHWPETFCMAALEAQACGTPVIAPPLGALNETVKGGILTYDFLNAISQLRNKARWRKLSLAGREWAERFDWGLVAERWIVHFEDFFRKQEAAQ